MVGGGCYRVLQRWPDHKCQDVSILPQVRAQDRCTRLEMTRTTYIITAIALVVIGLGIYAAFVTRELTVSRSEVDDLSLELGRQHIAAENARFDAIHALRAAIKDRDAEITRMQITASAQDERLRRLKQTENERRKSIARMDTTELIRELRRVFAERGQAE